LKVVIKNVWHRKAITKHLCSERSTL